MLENKRYPPAITAQTVKRRLLSVSSEELQILSLTALFIISRIIFFMQGGEFIATPLAFAKQYLDPLLLKDDLFRSLFYLHSQPPLFNCFLGLILKVSPLPELSFELLFKTAGILMPLLFYGILTALAIRPVVAFMVAAIYMLNPTLILYENLLYYTHLEAFLILLALFGLLHWALQRKARFLLLFFLALLSLGMIRSLFHTIFFLITAAALTVYVGYVRHQKQLARQFGIYSLIVLLPMLAWSFKNTSLYRFFGTSSWDGLSLWIKANGYAPEQLEEFNKQGIISDVALKAGHEPFQPLNHFFNDRDLQQIPCHHPADCSAWRSSGKPNFNHAGYVGVSKQLWSDAQALVRKDPALFAYYTAGSYCLMLWHASDSVHALFYNNAQLLERLETLYRFLYFGFLGVESKQASTYRWWVRCLCITLLFLFFYSSALVSAFRKADTQPLHVVLPSIFCVLIHAYTLCVSSLIEFGENNRFRYPIDASFLVLVAATVISWKYRLIRVIRSDDRWPGSALPTHFNGGSSPQA